MARRIGYVTDIEGSIDFFNEYVRKSQILRYDSESKLQLEEDAMFVFGGDLFDNGPGDIRLSSLLLDLKKRYPSRCFLLIGNRDYNKLRFAAELSEQDMERPIDEIPPLGIVGNTVGPRLYLEEMGFENTKTNRLKWMLDKNLGCSRTFEFRREEIALLEEKQHVSDEEVTNSFIESVKNGGFVCEYLKAAQIGVVIGDTLFIHGGVDEKNCRFVPAVELPYFDRDTGEAIEYFENKVPGYQLPDSSSLEEWINHLNQFASDSLNHYFENPLWDSNNRRGGEALIAYQSMKATQERNVMVSSAIVRGVLGPIDQKVETYLKENGVSRVIVGHKPVGDSPLVVREGSQIERIFADISRSDPSSSDGRGQAITEIIVYQFPERSEKNYLQIHGVLSDGQEYKFDLSSVIENTEENNSPIGFKTSDGFWVKAAMSDGKFRVAKTVGHSIYYEHRPREEIELQSQEQCSSHLQCSLT